MRARLALVAAFAAAAVPFAPAAHALVCNPLIEPVCETLCQIDRTLGRPCPR